MNKIFFVLIAFYLLLTACSIHGNFEGLYSYYKQTKEKTPALLVDTDTTMHICSLVNAGTPKVYIVNGSQLKNCIKENDVVVYIWRPRCTGAACYSLNLIQKKCDALHKDLFIVAECYDSELMGMNYNIKRPILGIDTRHYHSDVTSRYLSRFLHDLTSKENITGRVLFFQKGVFVRSGSDIDSVVAL